MDILHTQFPEYRPSSDRTSSDRTSSSRREGKSPGQPVTEDRDLAPAHLRASSIEDGADAERRATSVAQIIRERQASGFYHRPDVLREIAARLLASPELGGNGPADFS